MEYDLSALDGFDWLAGPSMTTSSPPAPGQLPEDPLSLDRALQFEATASFDLQLALSQELSYLQSRQWDQLAGDWARSDDLAAGVLGGGPGQQGGFEEGSFLAPSAGLTGAGSLPPVAQQDVSNYLQYDFPTPTSTYPDPPLLPAFEDVFSLAPSTASTRGDVNPSPAPAASARTNASASASASSRSIPSPPGPPPRPQAPSSSSSQPARARAPSHPGKDAYAHHHSGTHAYPQPLSADPFGPLQARLVLSRPAPSPPRVLAPARPLSICVPGVGAGAGGPPYGGAGLLPPAPVAGGGHYQRRHEVTVFALPAAPVQASGGAHYYPPSQSPLPAKEGSSYAVTGTGRGPARPEYTLPSPALSASSSSSASMSTAPSPGAAWLASPRIGAHVRARSSPGLGGLGSPGSRRSLPLPLQRPAPARHTDSAPPALPTFVLPSPPTTPRLSSSKPASTPSYLSPYLPRSSSAAASLGPPRSTSSSTLSSSPPRSPSTPKRVRSVSAQGEDQDLQATPSPAKRGRAPGQAQAQGAVTPGTLARFKFVNFGEGDGERLRAGVAPSGTGRKRK